jgi:hypothetical protein
MFHLAFASFGHFGVAFPAKTYQFSVGKGMGYDNCMIGCAH